MTIFPPKATQVDRKDVKGLADKNSTVVVAASRWVCRRLRNLDGSVAKLFVKKEKEITNEKGKR